MHKTSNNQGTMKKGVLVNKNIKATLMMAIAIGIITQRNIKEVAKDKLPMMIGLNGIHGLISVQKALLKGQKMTIINNKASGDTMVDKIGRKETRGIAGIAGIIVITGTLETILMILAKSMKTK